MNYGSVCSGIEAATVAWEGLGWRAGFYSEIDAFPCAVLNHYYPKVPNRGDMTKFKEWPDANINVLVGGTPCQSFSVAGLRKGLDDPRGNLTLTYLAVADKYRPEWLVWENVPGVLSDGTGAFGAFLGGLGQLGYGFAYRVLNAQYFGVPQRRRRVFVVGCAGGWRRAAAVLFERASLRGDLAPGRQSREGIAPTISARTKGGGGLGTDFDCDGGLVFDETQITSAENFSNPKPGDPCHPLAAGARPPTIAFSCKDYAQDATDDIAPTLRGMSEADGHANGGGQVAIAFHNRQDPDVSGHVTHPLGAQDNGMGVALPLTSRVDRGGAHREAQGNNLIPIQGIQSVRERKQNGIGIGDPGDEMFTLTGRDRHGFQMDMQVRRLTPRECERLQGFPDDYTLITYNRKPAKDGPRYKALGNSMAVPVMRWIGERISAVEEVTA